jgi:hypothetical protein
MIDDVRSQLLLETLRPKSKPGAKRLLRLDESLVWCEVAYIKVIPHPNSYFLVS